MRKKTFWKKIFRWQQKPGWCGPAVIQMALASAGIQRPQAKIAKDVFQPWWGTNQQAIYSYLSRFFKKLDFKENAYLRDIQYHLKRGHIVIVNWWDDLGSDTEQDGHYSLILDVDRKNNKLTLADPSTGRGIWQIDIKSFNKRWWDYLDVHGRKWVDGWMLWLDPNSKYSSRDLKI